MNTKHHTHIYAFIKTHVMNILEEYVPLHVPIQAVPSKVNAVPVDDWKPVLHPQVPVPAVTGSATKVLFPGHGTVCPDTTVAKTANAKK